MRINRAAASSTRLRAAAAAVCLLLPLFALAGCGEFGPPVPTVVERPALPADAPAANIHTWSVDRVTVTYYWYDLNKYDIAIEAKGYFPDNYQKPDDAIWQVDIHTIPSADLPHSVPGSYLGVQHSWIDAANVKQFEILPGIGAINLKEGMYAVMENGVEFTDGDPKTIKSIQPILHIRMVRDDGQLDPWFDMPVHLNPKNPTALTPVPKVGDGDGGRGTPMRVPVAAPDGEGAKSIPIPGVTGAGGP